MKKNSPLLKWLSWQAYLSKNRGDQDVNMQYAYNAFIAVQKLEHLYQYQLIDDIKKMISDGESRLDTLKYDVKTLRKK